MYITMPSVPLITDYRSRMMEPRLTCSSVSCLDFDNSADTVVMIDWDNYEAHKAFMDAPHYPTVIEKLKPCFKADGGKSEMLHVEFSAPTIALDKPVTEVTIITLKAAENRAAVVEILSGLSEVTKNLLVFGKSREDENKYVVIGGWQTVEVRVEEMKKCDSKLTYYRFLQEHVQMAATPEVAAAVKKLSSLVNRDHLYHTKLLKYSP